MADENQTGQVPPPASDAPEPTPVETPVVASDSAAQPAPTPSLEELLDKADAKALRSHPKIAGIVGSETANRIAELQRRQQEDTTAKQREETEREMFKLFEDNADYVKENYPGAYKRFTEMQQERVSREVQGIKGKTIHELANSIGRAVQDVPEWKELTPADHETLAKALVGKSDDEVIPVFNRLAIDLIADRRANRKMAEWKEKELKSEREVIRQEVAAQLAAQTETPGNGKAPKGAPAGINVKEMSDQDFDAWYNQTLLNR